MTRNFTEHNATAEVIARYDDCTDARLKQVSVAAVKHLHAFVREVEPSPQEWIQAIEFLTRVGQKCDDKRQEFILLSDVFGVSTLVDAIANRRPQGATESTVEGPFHMVASPAFENGADIARHGSGEPLVVTGRVMGLDGQPIAGAMVDVWQADERGFYDVQKPGEVPDANLRGLFEADGDGRFWFRSILPCYYPIPTDGPVGAMVLASGRHPYRPAHIHFVAQAPGFMPVTSHLFVEGDPYIESDVVFGVKASLIRDFVRIDDADRAAGYGVANPFHYIDHTIALASA
ncbi:MAG: 6-chlorohydroxyquinol-1,2-dioxygenase [Sphingomonadales bacterium]|nr:6-chlorohydroxyquinol-1,2-dioxygenase [Sphingomonadales bacterium]